MEDKKGENKEWMVEIREWRRNNDMVVAIRKSYGNELEKYMI